MSLHRVQDYRSHDLHATPTFRRVANDDAAMIV